jgi:hypothetical protein
MQRNTFHGDLACDAWSLGKWFPTFRRKVQGLKPSERTLLRNVENNEVTKHHTPEDDIPPLHHCENKIKKSQQFCLFLREVMWHRGFAVSRHVARREISQNAGGVHCYCWMNLGVMCILCARCSRNRKVVSILLSFRVFVSHVAWPA